MAGWNKYFFGLTRLVQTTPQPPPACEATALVRKPRQLPRRSSTRLSSRQSVHSRPSSAPSVLLRNSSRSRLRLQMIEMGG